MLSLRHKTNDHFWFSFFHEAGHLLLHGKRLRFIDMEGALSDVHEEQANEFAKDLLIPATYAKKLAAINSADAVRTLADQLGVAPGIIVGRMQKEGLLPWTHLNKLKVRYEWMHEAIEK